MSFIEGVGDEVIAFAVILLVFILAATITFLLNSSPFQQHRQISSVSQETLSNQSPEQQQTVNEDCVQENDDNVIADSNHTTSNINNDEEITNESEVVNTNEDQEVSSENTSNSQLYPDINERVSPDVETGESNVDSEQGQHTDPDEIHIRLKYLDDTERTVTSNPKVKIGDFKRTHFAEDIANNKVVRLIFSGQVLQDHATLQSYAVSNNCVVHVQILQAQTQQNSSFVSQNTDLDLSHLLWPLLSIILGMCWILYLKYPEFFNLMSLGMLFLFTGCFIYFNTQIHQ